MIWQQWALLAYVFLGTLTVVAGSARTQDVGLGVRGLVISTVLVAVVLSI